jgi:hypothetical protein
MPFTSGKLKGQLTAAEIRKLIRGHNKLVSIKIPPKTDRDGLIKLIEDNGYKLDHKKQMISDARKTRPRRQKITLDQAKELTKPKQKTALQKQKAKEKKEEKEIQKKKEVRQIKKEAVKKEKEVQKKKKEKPTKAKVISTQTETPKKKGKEMATQTEETHDLKMNQFREEIDTLKKEIDTLNKLSSVKGLEKRIVKLVEKISAFIKTNPPNKKEANKLKKYIVGFEKTLQQKKIKLAADKTKKSLK